MKPLKLDHDHAAIQRLNPVKLVDLRDYGLGASAPQEDGRAVMVFTVRDDGVLVPAT